MTVSIKMKGMKGKSRPHKSVIAYDPGSPAGKFFDERVKEGDDYFDAIIRLLFTDIPLDRSMRDYIGVWLQMREFLGTKKRAKEFHNRVIAVTLLHRKEELEAKHKAKGATHPAQRALDDVAAEAGIAVSTQRQNIYRRYKPTR
jgi:hypothetical protein